MEKLEGGAGVGVLFRANLAVVDNLQGGKIGQMLLRLLPLHKIGRASCRERV